jgi:hypothetical protein
MTMSVKWLGVRAIDVTRTLLSMRHLVLPPTQSRDTLSPGLCGSDTRCVIVQLIYCHVVYPPRINSMVQDEKVEP